jgi:molecular chaperone Hsp33
MIKVKPYGETLKEQLLAGASDRLHNFTLAGGTVRGVLGNGTRMVNEMRANHELGILETLVLGRAYLGVALMSAGLKGRDRIGLQIDCSGAIQGLSVEANAYGEVRGYLKQVPIPLDAPPDSFDLSPLFGAGFLSVSKYLEDARQPFTGRVILRYGNLAQDLAFYCLASEQIPTAFNLSIHYDREGEVIGAGGLLLQALPGADDRQVAGIEDLVRSFPSLGEAFGDGKDAETLIRDVFESYAPKLLANRRIEFFCRCNRDRVHNILAMLPIEDLQDILSNGPFPLQTRCHHCNTLYDFTREDIQRIYGLRYPDN